MSNLLYMDESNCNGVYASKANNPAAATPTTTTPANAILINTTNNTNNISNIMNVASTVATAAATAATATATATGTGTTTNNTLPTSVSNEDLSQSLSEYTDADESISAPTEFLAEFLSAVMLKDYKKALKYCKLILQYEPNNATAKEFYPLILDKLRAAASSDSDENYNKSSSPEFVLELQSSDPSAGESDGAASDDQQAGLLDDGVDDFGMPEDNCNSAADPNSHDLNACQSSRSNSNSSDSGSGSGSAGNSLSESVDDDNDDIDDDVDDDDDDEDVDVDDDEEECEEEEEDDVISSSGDDLPIDDPHSLGAAAGAGNDSQSSRNSSSGGGGGGRSRSDNTTHSYSSLLLEEEDDIVPINLKLNKELSSPDLDVSNGNKLPSTSCSDSESPTEPLTQRLAAILRSKCGVSSAGENF